MKYQRVVVALVLALPAVFVPSARANGDNVRNAAHWYERAVGQLETLSDEQLNMVMNYVEARVDPSPELRSTLRALAPTLALLRRGAAQQYSDYGLDFSKGFELTLPHLGQLRNGARLLRAEALVKMHDGDVAGASRDLASMYQIGGHLSDDRVLISALVGTAIFNFADESVQSALDRGAIDTSAAAELAGALQQLDEDDPFGFVESIFSEHELMMATLSNDVHDDGDMHELASMIGGSEEQAHAIVEKLQDADVDAEMAKFDGAMNDVAEILLLEDTDEGQQRLNDWESKIENGDYGVFATLLMPGYGKAYQLMIEARSLVAERRAMLEKLAQGELDPAAMANAALVYQQAIDAFNALPEQQRATLQAAIAQPADAVDEEIVAALAETALIFDLLRKGSLLRRCDFRSLRRHESSQLLPEYLLGMHQLLELVAFDALRHARVRDGAATADRLAIGYAMIGHLGADDLLMSPLVAHNAFAECTALLRHGLQLGILNEHHPQLQDAVRRIARRDPFGYINAVMQTRIALAKQLRRMTSSEQGFDRDTIKKLVENWQGDEMLFVLTVLETLDENALQRHTTETADAAVDNELLFVNRMQQLGDVVSIVAIQDVQAGIGDLAPQLAVGNIDLITGLQIPSISNWRQRMQRARADLRDVYQLLDVADEALNADAPVEPTVP